MSWTKLPAIQGSTACLTCGCGSHDTFPKKGIIAVGFGSASVTRDGKCVYDESSEQFKAEKKKRNPKFWTLETAERAAAKDPDHDWRICMHAPLYDAVYQRQDPGHWVLVEKGMGFA